MTDLHYDLLVIGAGSGNMVLGDLPESWRVAIVEEDRFGGTCLNRGCIPSKMLVHTADVAETVRDAGRFGIGAELVDVNWPAVRQRVFGRLDPKDGQAVAYQRRRGVDVYRHEARFVSPTAVEVGGDQLSADRVVLATGSRPHIPGLAGLESTPYLTSDTVMRIETLPASMVVLGGGAVAAEMSHVFGSLGVKVTIIGKDPVLLDDRDEDVSESFTSRMRDRFEVWTSAEPLRVGRTAGGMEVHFEVGGVVQSVEAEVLLVATGRRPNSDRLDVSAAGIGVDEHGHVVVDKHYRTGMPGIWAFGDLVNHFGLKHMANAEGRVVHHNLTHPEDLIELIAPVVPSAVFAHPQVASAGLTEQWLRSSGARFESATVPYRDVAYGWALEDTGSFVKVIADPVTRLVIGAHIIGAEASLLIQPLVQAMCLRSTVDALATQVIYPHPALSEAVHQALLKL
jgi:mycothione reductase